MGDVTHYERWIEKRIKELGDTARKELGPRFLSAETQEMVKEIFGPTLGRVLLLTKGKQEVFRTDHQQAIDPKVRDALRCKLEAIEQTFDQRVVLDLYDETENRDANQGIFDAWKVLSFLHQVDKERKERWIDMIKDSYEISDATVVVPKDLMEKMKRGEVK